MDFFKSAIEVLQTLVIALALALACGASLTFWKVMVMITPARMLMVNKEVQKQGKDRTPRCYSVQPRQIAEQTAFVNGQDARRICAAVDKCARFTFVADKTY